MFQKHTFFSTFMNFHERFFERCMLTLTLTLFYLTPNSLKNYSKTECNITHFSVNNFITMYLIYELEDKTV